MKKNNKIYLLIYSLVIVICLCMVGTAIAKYIGNIDYDEPVVETPEFYFTSNLLKEPDITNSIPTYYLSESYTSLEINLFNYENSLMYSECDIKYEITVTKGSTTIGTLTGTILKDACNIESVELSLSGEGEYQVAAKSTSPFVKELKAKFVVGETSDSIQYIVDDATNSQLVKLTIQTNNYSGNVSISWLTSLTPDNTNPLLEDAINLVESSGYYTYTVNFEAYSSYVFIFFKDLITDNYTEADFIISKTN